MEVKNDKLKELLLIPDEEATKEDNDLLLKELVKAQLFVPVEITSKINLDNTKIGEVQEFDEPLHFKPLILKNKDGETFIPLFTDEEEFKKSCPTASSIVMFTSDIANMIKNGDDEYSGIVINPFNDNSVMLPVDSFIGLFKDDADKLIELFDNAEPLPEEIVVFQSSDENTLFEESEDGIYYTKLPLAASLDEKKENEKYMNILILPQTTRITYFENEEGRDILLAPGSEFKLQDEIDGHIYVWRCTHQYFYED